MYNKLRELAKEYLKARQEFLIKSEKIEELKGNDNIVGRIGELVAIQFLQDRGIGAIKNSSQVQKGYDLTANNGKNKISVKIITAENKSGRTTKIKNPWTDLVLITLNSAYTVEKIGFIKNVDLKKAVLSGVLKSEEPYASRKLLDKGSVFDLFGTIWEGDSVKKYL